MMGFAQPDAYGTTITIGSNVSVNGPTATTWIEPTPRPYVIVIYGSDANYPEQADNPFEGVEPLWRRRWRLSLEAIDRYKRLARRVRLRVRGRWYRPLHVARVCAQSERWRVLAA